jgi:hypothetical protein
VQLVSVHRGGQAQGILPGIEAIRRNIGYICASGDLARRGTASAVNASGTSHHHRFVERQMASSRKQDSPPAPQQRVYGYADARPIVRLTAASASTSSA